MKVYILLTLGQLKKILKRNKKVKDCSNETLIIFSEAFGDGVIFQDYLKQLIKVYEKENYKLCIVARSNVRYFYIDVLGFEDKHFSKMYFFSKLQGY